MTKKAFLTLLASLSFGACGLKANKNGENDIALKRVYAPVMHFDCNGNAQPVKEEEVEAPQQWIRIEADNDHHVETAEIKSVSHPTDSGMLAYTQNNSVSFLAHYSDTWLGYRVGSGANEFTYKLWDTADQSVPAFEEGSVTLNVSYEEVHETAIREAHPTYEECHPSPTPIATAH